jgi:hypothetical protein
MDLEEHLRALLLLAVPVPCMERPGGELVVARQAMLSVRYPQEALVAPQPGYSFVQVVAPHHVWHPNVHREHGQPLCLGDRLPVNTPVTEIVLMSYGALSMNVIMADERDSAGVLNHEAARWWLANRDRAPLSTEPFLEKSATVGPGAKPEPQSADTL